MKKLILILLLSTEAFASGKLSVKPTYFPQKDTWGGMVGMSVHEKVFKPLSYSGWLGGVRSKDVEYSLATKQDVELQLWRVAVGMGVGGSYNFDTKFCDYDVHSQLSVQLW